MILYIYKKAGSRIDWLDSASLIVIISRWDRSSLLLSLFCWCLPRRSSSTRPLGVKAKLNWEQEKERTKASQDSVFVCRAYIQGAAAAARRLDWIEFGVAAGARKRSPCVNATTRVMQYQEQRGFKKGRKTSQGCWKHSFLSRSRYTVPKGIYKTFSLER